MSENKQSENPISLSFGKRVTKAAGICIALILLVWLLLKGFKVLMLVLAGSLMAIFFLGIAHYLSKYLKIPKHSWALATSIFAVFLVFGLLGYFLAPHISRQVTLLQQELPQQMRQLRTQVKDSQVGGYLWEQLDKVKTKGIQQKALNFFAATYGVVGDVYIIFFLGIFFLVNPKQYQKSIILLFPLKAQKRANEVVDKMGTTLRKWLMGKLLSMIITGGLTGLGLMLLGVPLSLTLGLLTGLLAFIPNFGPLIALIPTLLMALAKGPEMMLYAALLFAGIQAVTSTVILPLIQKNMIQMPMAGVLIAQVLLGILAGGWALVLAVPLLAITIVLVKMVYRQDILNQPDVSV